MKMLQKVHLIDIVTKITQVILMSRMQKIKGLVAASLRLKTINDNPLLKYGINI